MAIGAPASSPYGPPPLPTRSAPVSSGGHGMTLLVVVLVVAAVAYYYYTQVLHKSLGGGDASAAASSSSSAPAPPPPTAAEQKTQTAVCKAKGIVHGTCELDAAAGAVYAKCDDQWYGTACNRKCPTSAGKAVVYTAGYEGGPTGSPNAATCACPSTSHFQNSDLTTGCRLGDASGDGNCEAGWHGEKCDQQGDYKNCQHGTLNTDGSCSPCDAGYEGSLCQFPSDWCTKIDKGATLDATNDTCTCSNDSAGNPMYTSTSRCQEAASGYVISGSGTAAKAKPWKDSWQSIDASATVQYVAGDIKQAGCANCNDASGAPCTKDVKLCDLLKQNPTSSAPTIGSGCVSIDTLCTTGLVPSFDVGGKNTCMLTQSCLNGKDNRNWFKKMTVPEGVQASIKTTPESDPPLQCSPYTNSSVPYENLNGSDPTSESPIVTSAAPWQPDTWEDEVAMTFKLQPGYMVSCPTTGGGTQPYLGKETATARYPDSDNLTSSTEGAVIKT